MSQVEFERWQQFYQLSPFDDLHRFHRPAAIIAHSMAGTEISKLLEFLRPPLVENGYSSADLATLGALGAIPPGK